MAKAEKRIEAVQRKEAQMQADLAVVDRSRIELEEALQRVHDLEARLSPVQAQTVH